jgi:hypothetical protein
VLAKIGGFARNWPLARAKLAKQSDNLFYSPMLIVYVLYNIIIFVNFVLERELGIQDFFTFISRCVVG